MLWAAGVCADADLKALAAGRSRPWQEEGPMGPTRISLAKPVIAAVAGHTVGVSRWPSGAICASSRKTPSWVSSTGAGASGLLDWGTVRLPALVGLGRVLDIVLWSFAMSPGLTISVTGLAVNTVGDRLRDYLDPELEV